MRRDDRPKSVVILPVRMSAALYEELAVLAGRDETNRCAMVRKLILNAARRTTQRREEAARGR
jgi:hypothetical protein